MKQSLLILLIAAATLPDAPTAFAQSSSASGGERASGIVTSDGVPPLPGENRFPGVSSAANSPFGPPLSAAPRDPLPSRPYVTPDGVPPAGGNRGNPDRNGRFPQPGMPGSYAPDPTGLSGPTGVLDSPGSLTAPNSSLAPRDSATGSAGPASLSDPIDPLTGLPLRMTSLWPSRNGELQPLPPPMVESPIPSPIPHARIKASPGYYPDRPLDQIPPSDLLPTPDLPHLPGIPGPSYSGPVLFDGRVDGLIGAPLTRDPDALPLDTPPNPNIDFPQDTLLDPTPFDSGNRDGQLDWIDLIEEYAGRMTRSDIPDEPHNTPKEERSWLRIEHWRADATWFPTTGDSLGWLTGYGDVTIGLAKIRGLTITPGYAIHMLQGPARTDLPNTLHDLRAEVAWMRRFDARWRLRLAGTAGFYSDHLNLSNGLRFSGQTLVTYECNPDLQLVFGSSWLNLENRRVLPIGGLVWFINDRHRLDLIFPEWKFAFVAQETLLWTKWAYATGGFWGRTWQIDRTSGASDDVTYSDWRVALGMEKKTESDIYSFLEVGIAFNRKLDYVSNVGDYRPDPFVFVRGGFHF